VRRRWAAMSNVRGLSAIYSSPTPTRTNTPNVIVQSAGEVPERERPSLNRILRSPDESHNRRHVDNHPPVNWYSPADHLPPSPPTLTAAPSLSALPRHARVVRPRRMGL
jgi:hypothetical protein